MDSKHISDEWVGVVGAGTFGTTIANILAENRNVLLLARRKEMADQMIQTRFHKGQQLDERIDITIDPEKLASRCDLIFPVVPSASFREMVCDLAPFLHPYHILIHATKGLDVLLDEGEEIQDLKSLSKGEIKTMSQLIYEETVVRRVGCIAGPNLASEIAEGQPAATVVASQFDEVIREGQLALRSSRFRVHATNDLLGIELAGALKNIFAIAAGILEGQGLGDNTLALLITRGLAEMVALGKAMGADPRAFLGLAGIGDLVATCNSSYSRNHTLGKRLSDGEKLNDILDDMEEVAEGVNTICIAKAIATHYKISAPITQALHRVLFEGMDIPKGMRLLMEHPFRADVNFI
jgi:glycerol-3-phosphate dehydrogenase (NAD(P)+)